MHIKITVEATGFNKVQQVDINLLTEQNLSVPITLKVGSISEQVTVTTEAPVVDTADSRTHLTLESRVSRSVAGCWTQPCHARDIGAWRLRAWEPVAPGSPGSGVDNYSTETQVDANANGQGQNNNQYVVDGLDVTSGIRQGVLNLTPNPDAIQETSIQVNTFSSEYSRAADCRRFSPRDLARTSFTGRRRTTSRIRKCLLSSISPAPLPAVPLEQHVVCDWRPDHSTSSGVLLLRG